MKAQDSHGPNGTSERDREKFRSSDSQRSTYVGIHTIHTEKKQEKEKEKEKERKRIRNERVKGLASVERN